MADILGLTLNDSMTLFEKINRPRHYQDILSQTQKVSRLSAYLDTRDDFQLTKINWTSGIIVAVKLNSPNFG